MRIILIICVAILTHSFSASFCSVSYADEFWYLVARVLMMETR